MPDAKDVVYVVAKAPRPGQSKTRLCPPLTPDQAAHLAAAFLQDTIALVRRADVELRLICRDAAERDALIPYAAGAPIHVQDRAGLGAAMECAFAHALRDGCRAAAVLGTDTPTLPPEVLSDAFAHLDQAEVALGPSEDGGYYLLAALQPHPTLFRDMDMVWGTSTVAQETLARCAALGLRTHLLPRWLDIDTPADLTALRRQLTGPHIAPHTRAALATLDSLP